MSGDFEQAKSRVCQSEGAYVSVRPLASSWEQRKLGNCGTTYGGLTGKTKEDFGHGNARFIPYTNVFDNPLTDTKRLEAVEIDSSQNQVAYGDVFFTVSSETPDEVGMSSVWLSDQEDVYLNSFCFGYRQDSTFDPHYLAYMLRSSSVRSDLTLLAQGISRFNISKNKVMELSVPVPSAVEQKQLGQYFTKFDNLITLHQRKCQYRSLYGYLSWEQRKFADEVYFFTGLTYTPSDVVDSPGTLVLRSSNVSGGGIVLDDNVYVNSSTPLSENVKPGDIIVVVRNGSRALIGKHAQVRHEMPNTVIGAFMTGIRSRVPQFINALLSTPAFENEVAMNMGATINQITLGMFGAMSFSFPSVSEQKAIGALFYQLDSLITLHQHEPRFADTG